MRSEANYCQPHEPVHTHYWIVENLEVTEEAECGTGSQTTELGKLGIESSTGSGTSRKDAETSPYGVLPQELGKLVDESTTGSGPQGSEPSEQWVDTPYGVLALELGKLIVDRAASSKPTATDEVSSTYGVLATELGKLVEERTTGSGPHGSEPSQQWVDTSSRY